MGFLYITQLDTQDFYVEKPLVSDNVDSQTYDTFIFVDILNLKIESATLNKNIAEKGAT